MSITLRLKEHRPNYRTPKGSGSHRLILPKTLSCACNIPIISLILGPNLAQSGYRPKDL